MYNKGTENIATDALSRVQGSELLSLTLIDFDLILG